LSKNAGCLRAVVTSTQRAKSFFEAGAKRLAHHGLETPCSAMWLVCILWK